MLAKRIYQNLSSTIALLPTLLSSVVSPAIAVPLPPLIDTSHSTPLIAQAVIDETVLFFETENFAVRIFRRGENLFMNLFNKQTGVTEVQATPAELVANTRNWITYRNSLGESYRFARQGLAGQSELEIVNPEDNSTIVKETGYNTVIGVADGATDFIGNNFAPGTEATINAPRYAELRQTPQPEADIIITVPRGDFVDVIDRVGNPADGFIWYKVIYNGTAGWIRGDVLTPN